jgi:hypothetical protein
MILVMAMVPAGAVTANAASVRYTSNDAANILKGSATFYKEEGSGKIGYSTPSSYSGAKNYLNGISKENAETLMKEYLKKEKYTLGLVSTLAILVRTTREECALTLCVVKGI